MKQLRIIHDRKQLDGTLFALNSKAPQGLGGQREQGYGLEQREKTFQKMLNLT
jgi:hypothetical protein